MALWQFDLRVGPYDSFLSDNGDLLFVIPPEQFEEKFSWRNSKEISGLKEGLSDFMTSYDSWSKNLECWGEDDGDRVEVYYSDSIIDEWYIRFDMRTLNFLFCLKMVEVVKKYNGVFITSSGYVFPPAYKKLLNHMHRSDNYRFVQDPQRFLEELSDKKERD